MKRLICLLLITMAVNCTAQERQDSLVKATAHLTEDSNGVKLLVEIAKGYQSIDADKGIRYAQQGLDLSQKIDWPTGMILSYNRLGGNSVMKADYPNALDYFFKALKIAEDQKNKEWSARLFSNIGLVYDREKNYSKALEYQLKSLAIAEERGDKKTMCINYANIGSVYTNEANYPKALDYTLKALNLAQELGLKDDITFFISSAGGVYMNMKMYDKSLEYHFKALKLAREMNDIQNISTTEGNLGETYLSMVKDTAYANSNRAEHISKAISYLKSGIEGCKKINYWGAVPEFMQYLAEAYTLAGDYKMALTTYQDYNKIKDSVFSATNNARIATLETKRALELKDKDLQIARLAVAKKRNERVFYIAGIMLLLLVIVFIYRNFRTERKSNSLLTIEKKRSDDLLRNILPSEVAEELKENGKAAARNFDHVSVLFTDFVNFTGIAERLTADELVQELNTCFTAFDAIIERNGLEKIKTIGDAYLAVCGLPLNDPQHAQKTVRAAIEIRDLITQRMKGEQNFAIRIGISSGPVVAGIVGVKKFAYDIWGDTVNTAARMEQHSEMGKVNISGATFELVKNEFICSYRGKVNAKNKGDVDMYFVEMKA